MHQEAQGTSSNVAELQQAPEGVSGISPPAEPHHHPVLSHAAALGLLCLPALPRLLFGVLRVTLDKVIRLVPAVAQGCSRWEDSWDMTYREAGSGAADPHRALWVLPYMERAPKSMPEGAISLP